MNARNPHAGSPFADDDAAIAAALEDVSIPALMLSLVHLTGDPSYIRGPIKPRMLVLNEVQGFMPEEEKAEVRRMALEAIKAYRDGGCELPTQPGPELLHEMMNWVACEEIPQEYVPMLFEEMELDGVDARRGSVRAEQDVCADFPVLVIGCGQSGLLAGIRLKEAGIPFTIVEKNAGVGGTWYENTYPGARVDVGNHFYCYSFEPVDQWTEFYARQPELQSYFQGVMERHGVDKHVRWNTEVLSAEWDEAAAVWRVAVCTGGVTETLTARAVISAVGMLNRPKLPEIDGMDEFAGPSFHSARWDHDVDYRGKKVVQIGAGASGFQIAPTLAPDVERLTVFQRTAQWMFPNAAYHSKTGPGVQWAMRHLPFYGRWYRFMIFWPGSDGALMSGRIDPEWPHQDRAVSARNDQTRVFFTDWIKSQVGDDEELLAKVVPDYPATGKRTLQDNGSWLRALKRDNVDLVREGIARIEKDAVVTESGARYEADVIVYATGFQANRFLWPMRIVGRDGAVLSEQWGDEPTAYLGITVKNFPNFFCLYGPGTGLAHGGSLIFQSECQMRYVMACVDKLVSDGHRAMEPTEEAQEAYTERQLAEIKTMVWSSPAIRHSWFKNAAGDIYTASPWRLVDYWNWTKGPDMAHYTVR
ncbi:NAD(P)/FAD-dependent oxidoreductase [Yinghuangia aomiensis]|uniref:NAD(P)/FAD-dependent oxidoreductase n=1 Tax=Yinghuangia aomiensis TaxID=676205 RepID=A0ABP9I501_9ACTN